MSVENRIEIISSDDVLAAGATFTSEWHLIEYNHKLTGYAISDKDSSGNGFLVQQSSDKSTVDIVEEMTVVANTAKPFSIDLYARHVRIVYTNAATLQGSFRLVAFLQSS